MQLKHSYIGKEGSWFIRVRTLFSCVIVYFVGHTRGLPKVSHTIYHNQCRARDENLNVQFLAQVYDFQLQQCNVVLAVHGCGE